MWKLAKKQIYVLSHSVDISLPRFTCPACVSLIAVCKPHTGAKVVIAVSFCWGFSYANIPRHGQRLLLWHHSNLYIWGIIWELFLFQLCSTAKSSTRPLLVFFIHFVLLTFNCHTWGMFQCSAQWKMIFIYVFVCLCI